MNQQRYFEDVTEGEAIAPLMVPVTPVQMFFFSAATYNGHLIHYNETWSTAMDGHPGLVIHGPLQIALLTRMVTDWIGPQGRLISYSVQSRGSAYAGDTVHCTGTVERKHPGDGLIDLALQATRNGRELLIPGNAAVRLPARPAT